jgi:hypothetical protein
MSLIGKEFRNGVYSDELDNLLLNDDERELVKSLFLYYQTNDNLPTDFTKAFTAFCVGEEFEDMIFELEEHPFYAALSESFQISWKSDGTYYIAVKPPELAQEAPPRDSIVDDNHPLIFNCGNKVYTVNNCEFTISEIQVANQPFKSSNYSVIFRIYGTVKNLSNKTTTFMTTKGKSNIVGTYHGGEGPKSIGGNSFITWGVDSGKQLFSQDYTLSPGEERNIQVQALYTGTPATYDYKLEMDLYFTTGDEMITLTFG